jgi:hypothetical protein
MASQVMLSSRGPTVKGRLDLLRALIAYARQVIFLVRSLLQGSLEVERIAVFGRQKFRDNVAAALRLLRAQAPEAFGLCEQYFSVVIMSRHSGVDVTSRPAVVMLREWATRASPRYLASVLAHEAFHCRLYWSYREGHPGSDDVPPEIFSGETGERECVEYQIEVLKRLGGTDQEVSHLRDSLKTEYWKVPWHQRTW